MVINEQIYAMLLMEPYFRPFIRKEIANAETSAEAIVALSVDSREKVGELVDRALAAGGKAYSDPADQGFMYTRSFQDVDGHLWDGSPGDRAITAA